MNKNTFIILHGWDHNSNSWSTFKDMIEKDFKTITLDLPGFGNEPLQNNDWSIPEYAEWVTSKIENIDGGKILLGHSFGGKIASYIGSRNPSWLKALILYGAPSLRRTSLKTKIKIRLAKIAKSLKIKNTVFVKNTELSKADKDGLGQIFRKTINFDQTSLLPNIKIPTLLIWGELDTACPIHIAEEMHRLIPGSDLIILSKVGHNAHLENPYLFYGTIKNFLKTF